LIIDFTILPLAPETKIERYVLATKNMVNKIISTVTLSFHLGATIFHNYVILLKN
jgi:hypothetical protein